MNLLLGDRKKGKAKEATGGNLEEASEGYKEAV